jgi:hypothetical protein
MRAADPAVRSRRGVLEGAAFEERSGGRRPVDPIGSDLSCLGDGPIDEHRDELPPADRQRRSDSPSLIPTDSESAIEGGSLPDTLRALITTADRSGSWTRNPSLPTKYASPRPFAAIEIVMRSNHSSFVAPRRCAATVHSTGPPGAARQSSMWVPLDNNRVSIVQPAD